MPLHLIETKKCPACGAARPDRPLYRLKLFGVYRCLCGVKYIDPSLDAEDQMRLYQSSASLKEINPVLESYYEYDMLDPRSATYRDYKKALEAAEHQVSGRSLLEVGCGTGAFLDFAVGRRWKVCGIDSSIENTAKLSAKGIHAIPGDFLAFRSKEKFDLVVLWDVLEHSQEPARLLAKCREFLKPDGRLLIAGPYDPNLFSLIAGFIYLLTFGKIRGPLARWYVVEHASFFSRKGMESLLRCCGFCTVQFWKTETDLARYHFRPWTRIVLRIASAISGILGLSSRMALLARGE